MSHVYIDINDDGETVYSLDIPKQHPPIHLLLQDTDKPHFPGADTDLTIKDVARFAMPGLPHNGIYKGTLEVFEGKTDIPVVCKVVSVQFPENGAKIKVEKDLVYAADNLRHLQGNGIPRCFGYFVVDKEKTPNEDNQTHYAACLVLEHCGTPCSGKIKDLDRSVRCVVSPQGLSELTAHDMFDVTGRSWQI